MPTDQTVYAESDRTGTSYATSLSADDRASAISALSTHHREGIGVCVKDRTYWPNDSRTREAFAELSQETIDCIYDGVQRSFWDGYAPEVAQAHGYAGVWSAGRSDGYVVPYTADRRGLAFLENLDRDDPWSDTGIRTAGVKR